jgi:GT2 family glycosyltransferase
MKETGAAIAFGKCLFPGDNWGLRLFGDYENAKMEYVLGKCPPKYFFGCGRNMAVRSAVFKKFGNFSKSLFIEDTEFIQRCILRNPGTNVTYLNNARVTHMDITNIGLWFKKLKGYGRHSRHRNIPFYTPLNYRLKLQIYVYCCQLHHYDFLKKVAFFVLLICGDLSYKLGRLKHFFGRL